MDTKSALQILGEIGWRKLLEGNGLSMRDMLDISSQIATSADIEPDVRLKAANTYKDLAKMIITHLPAPAMMGDGDRAFDLSSLSEVEKEVLIKALPKAMRPANHG